MNATDRLQPTLVDDKGDCAVKIAIKNQHPLVAHELCSRYRTYGVPLPPHLNAIDGESVLHAAIRTECMAGLLVRCATHVDAMTQAGVAGLSGAGGCQSVLASWSHAAAPGRRAWFDLAQRAPAHFPPGLPLYCAFLVIFGAATSLPDSEGTPVSCMAGRCKRAGKTAAQIARANAYIATAKILESPAGQFQFMQQLLRTPVPDHVAATQMGASQPSAAACSRAARQFCVLSGRQLPPGQPAGHAVCMQHRRDGRRTSLATLSGRAFRM